MRFTGFEYLSSRLGRRMLVIFALCALVPVTALALVSYRAARADLEGQARERLHDATKNLGMSVLERFLFVLEELEFAGERLQRGQPLGLVQEFPDRLVGIVHLDATLQPLASVGDEFPLTDLRPTDRERLRQREPAITFPTRPEGAAAVLWLPLADGTVLAGAVEPAYGWGAGLQAVLPSRTDVIVLTPDGAPLLSTLSTRFTDTVSLAGRDAGGRQFDAEVDGVAYFGGRWQLPLRHDFGHPGLVLISLAERAAAVRRAAGFGREYALIGLCSLWIVLLLSIGQIRRNLAPLDELTEATRQLGERDFGHRVKVSSNDEFSELAESFNFMSDRLETTIEDLRELKQGALLALAGAVDAKSHWTTGHSERVTRVALRLGVVMGLSAERLDIINRGGLLHDIGKIGVPNAVLDKPGKLTDEEYEIMKQHPAIGARILEPIQAYADVLPIVLQHHERMDGKGYPYGIGAEEFDPDARIVAVADVFDACTSDRPYREGMPLSRVMEIIREGSGSHFDPVVVEALECLVNEKPEFFEQLRIAA